MTEKLRKIICFLLEDSTPSPCGHSPYLIYDEQRERIESITLTVFTPSEIYGDSPPPLCFAQQNIGEVAAGRRERTLPQPEIFRTTSVSLPHRLRAEPPRRGNQENA